MCLGFPVIASAPRLSRWLFSPSHHPKSPGVYGTKVPYAVRLRAGREFDVLRTNELEGLYWGTPSVAGDALLLREAKQLHCIREQGP